tara:strand:- start:12581 stop:13324 length:744 start_codon:yes stop_codon:yes gene_type:complete
MDLLKYILRIADSQLIIAQRLSEWCSKAPTLEEDIAISNLSLDLFGQANILLEYASKIDGKRSADDFAFHRDERNFYNFLITELPNGNFGDTITKHYLYTEYMLLFFEYLSQSSDEELSAISKKSIKELKYHVKHSKSWVIRLGDGTNESKNKIQKSFNDIWRFTGELFEMNNIDIALMKKNIAVDKKIIKTIWDEKINETFKTSKIDRPKCEFMLSGSIDGLHTENLGHILSEMQYIPRSFPNAKW